MSRSELIRRLQAILPTEAVLHDNEDLRPYECDGLSAYKQLPYVVVLPYNEAQVALYRMSAGYCYHWPD